MPVQMIELEEVKMMNVSDDALEAGGGTFGGFAASYTVGDANTCPYIEP